MNKSKRFSVIAGLVLLISIMLAGCSKANDDKIDYSNTANWAFYPESTENEVDVFFIAPTSGADKTYNMQMDDDGYKASFKGATTMEKGIYDTKADFYAPYYRQVSLECYSLPESEREQYLKIAYTDINEAFNYYLKNINNGRPYILAGFSQGGDMIKRILENNKIDDRMIAAYAIGWNFPEEELKKHPDIKMAQGEDDLGVVVSFCSESPTYNGANSIIVPTSTTGINPLNWKTDGTIADKSENLGACFTNYSGVILTETPALCGAYRDETRGTLKVTDVTVADYPAGLSFLEDGNFHLYDYQFFYRNLQKNVETRIDAYMSK